jgi:prolyl 4-hydroxylase
MDLKEYVLPQHTFIGGWHIPFNLCDDLIQIFKDNPKHQSPGVIVQHHSLKIDANKKESTDLAIDPKSNDPAFIIYKKYLQQVIHNYEQKYPEVKNLDKFGMIEAPQIKYYKPGQGFKIWHCERIGKENRCLVFATYLNTVFEAGTQFKYQDLTIPAEKGLTVIFPSDFTHTHRGQITKKHEKYILTGWLGYV